MTNAFIIHGAYGSPKENWIPWLKQELENESYRVFAPLFPTPEDQSFRNWFRIFREYLPQLKDDSIVIGHSLAPAFLLKIIEQHSIKAAFFVSPFITPLGNPDFDEINKTFLDKDYDWEAIKENCKHFTIFHSDNDPYVPLECAEKLAKKLGVQVTVIKDAGHFNEKAGYTKFDLLLNKIKEL